MATPRYSAVICHVNSFLIFINYLLLYTKPIGWYAHSTFHWWSTQCAARMLLLFSDEPMRCCAVVQIAVSIWGPVHWHQVDRWALSGADIQAPWQSVLERVWLHCHEAQQVGCLREWLGRRHPVTIGKASLMAGSVGRVWLLRHQTRAQYSAFECTKDWYATSKIAHLSTVLSNSTLVLCHRRKLTVLA